MPGVPENLMKRLHAANEQFREARQRLEDVGEMDMAQRQSLAASLRAAEKEVEDVTREIDACLNPAPQQPPPPS